ncbi:hypothetical protein [Nakamurella sp.]|uniref:hypothetical protein n=1 Tax=Nakamurella sp. TaxID=1869182 RepID=UPI00378525C0
MSRIQAAQATASPDDQATSPDVVRRLLAVLIDAVVHADGDPVDAAFAALATLETVRVKRTTTNRQRCDT